MDETPRPRMGRFPDTPTTAPSLRTPNPNPRSRSRHASPKDPDLPTPRRVRPLPLAPIHDPAAGPPAPPPFIPVEYLDAPTQRTVAACLYALLLSGRIIDWIRLGEEPMSWWDSALWKFLKWVCIDFAFLFGLPQLRIPWLELSQTFVLVSFACHAIFTFTLMFNVWPTFLVALFGPIWERMWDRELSLSEHHVSPSNILHNKSLIMGKQIINILPEGSATLNPDHLPFCLDTKNRKVARLPIHFNASFPVDMELVRIDLDTGAEESLRVSKSDMRKIQNQVREDTTAESSPGAVVWEYPVRKPGVYRLGRVLDQYKLEVQRQTKDTYVVPCPKATVKPTASPDRCLRDLSDLSLVVVGTAPLKIGYSRTINGKDHSFNFQSLQPDSFVSPLLSNFGQQAVADGSGDVSWVKPAMVVVPLNESMTTAGEWRYTIDEVRDGLGNIVKYLPDDGDAEYNPSSELEQKFTVKERPKVRLRDCDPRRPLKVAKGRHTNLPVHVDIGAGLTNKTYTVTWDFSPANTLTNDGEPGDMVKVGKFHGRNDLTWPEVSEPGLYTLRSVSNNGCEGEVEEPSSCLLLNPLEPQLSLQAEEIPDRCAGNSVGFNVDLHLVGTPPFLVRYDVVTGNGAPKRERIDIPGLRHQIILRPKEAGHHKYIFKQVDDAIYKGVPLMGSEMVLEQDVKPAASAVIQHEAGVMSACLEEEVEVGVLLLGEPPFSLEWEIFYDGKRKTEKATNLQDERFVIRTAPLIKGGEYIVTLNSVQDKSGCRTYLKEALKIAVRRQKPRAAFGMVEGTRAITGIQGSNFQIPLRLQGEDRWTVSYRNADRPDAILKHRARSGNDYLVTKERGRWEIVGVEDDRCPGTVDAQASTFSTDWFPKPQISLVQVESITGQADGVFEKSEICEGDVDGFEVQLQGNPPYHVGYQVKHKPFQGLAAVSEREFDAALSKASVSVDSSKPGDYTYAFSTLSDNLYSSEKDLKSLVLHQRVNTKPSASFVKPGQSFKYCQLERDNEDKIPITLKGVAPFSVEIEVKHSSGTAASTYRIPSISATSYGIKVPREHLRLGSQQVRIRKVRDARGCQQKYEVGGPSVQVNLYDAPAIYPLETRTDYCVGERISYTLSGTPPFQILYDFDGSQRRAKAVTTDFRRIAESPGVFTITRVSDKASECQAPVNIPCTIHPLPSIQISKGRQSRVDIHEGNEVDILFEFGGTPPFEFTYTRSTNARKGQRSVVLETRHGISHEHSKIIRASQEGTYEVVAIKDMYCSVSADGATGAKEKKLR